MTIRPQSINYISLSVLAVQKAPCHQSTSDLLTDAMAKTFEILDEIAISVSEELAINPRESGTIIGIQ